MEHFIIVIKFLFHQNNRMGRQYSEINTLLEQLYFLTLCLFLQVLNRYHFNEQLVMPG